MRLTVDYSPEFEEKLVELVRSFEDLAGIEKLEIVPSEDTKLRVSVDGRVIVDAQHEFSIEKIKEELREE